MTILPAMKAVMILAATIAALALAAVQPQPEQTFTGPALVCGTAFALRLAEGERLVRRDPGIDFLLYYAEGPEGSFLLYEGNAPQAHDDLVRTGLSWPDVIAIHDNRTAEAKARTRIRDRLLLGGARAAACAGR
jgi:hypothetical protein